MIALFFLSLLFSATHDAPENPAVPEWAQGALWYHIVPDRFRNGMPANDPTGERSAENIASDWQVHPWASNWYKRQVWEKDGAFESVIRQRRFGGDLLGIIEKLPYLKDLGVGVIHLTPVFESPSIFKYDAITLHHVDNNFGTARKEDWEAIINEHEDKTTWTLTKGDSALFALVDEARKADIKIVLDIEFNYVNRDFWAFKDLAAQQEDSKYRDWFEISGWDKFLTPDTNEFSYSAWQGNREWPRFKRDEHDFSAPVKTYLYDITKRWMDPDDDPASNDGIAGWFVRNWDELPDSFRKEWTDYVRTLNSNTLIVTDGSGEKYREPVVGRDLTLSDSLLNFIGSDTIYSAQKLDLLVRRLAEGRTTISPISGSRDIRAISAIEYRTDRDSLAGGPIRYFDKPSDSDYERFGLLMALHLTLPGSPSILQGDETGMWGSLRAEDFKPMLWWEYIYEDEEHALPGDEMLKSSKVEFKRSLYSQVRRLGQIRRKHTALRAGRFEPVLADDQKGVLGFWRKHGEDEALVLLNLTAKDVEFEFESPWEIGKKVKDEVSDTTFKIKEDTVTVTIKKRASLVLVKD